VAVGNPARVISNRVAAESESPEQHSHL
jgi:hypothetical protein